jgi:hypothetical protein
LEESCLLKKYIGPLGRSVFHCDLSCQEALEEHGICAIGMWPYFFSYFTRLHDDQRILLQGVTHVVF